MHARARRTDPYTSHQAAASVTDITEAQARVLSLYHRWGPLSDSELRHHYDLMLPDWPPISESGLRTRRSELVTLGKLKDTGDRSTTPSKRVCIIWGVV